MAKTPPHNLPSATEELLAAASGEDLEAVACALENRERAIASLWDRRNAALPSFAGEAFDRAEVHDAVLAFEKGENALAMLSGLKLRLQQEYGRLAQVQHGFAASGFEENRTTKLPATLLQDLDVSV